MAALQEHYLTLLKQVLVNNYVGHLPALINQSEPQAKKDAKNISRAFSAFAIANLCEISPAEAATAVIDDIDDSGLDAIYYHAPAETLYLVQAKLKASEQFSQDEALAFCQGVRRLVKQEFQNFNQHLQNRRQEIEDSVENCSHIQLVIAHTGSGISKHAFAAIEELIKDEDLDEERFVLKPEDYNADQIIPHLLGAQAYAPVNVELRLLRSLKVEDSKATYLGVIPLVDLAKLHNKYDKALYEKNIRTFLGHKTDVNTAIRKALQECPQDFFYLNNGVAALCQHIEPKENNKQRGGKKFKIRGLSVINGAQTVASAARFIEENPDKDISSAKVGITLIKADSDTNFGKSVTRARNHQNPVSIKNFVALDDEQERLRRELAHLGISYIYKAEMMDNQFDSNRIQVDEAALALSLFQCDPRFAVWLKKEPARMLDSSTDQYKLLFSPSLSAYKLVNAVRFVRYIQWRMLEEASAASGQERLTYKHGNFAIAWAMGKRLESEISKPKLIEQVKFSGVLSKEFDVMRQQFWDVTRPSLAFKGPLALFRNQTDVLSLVGRLLENNFGLSDDPVVGIKRNQQSREQAYQYEDLFQYLVSKAPQIGGLL